MRGMPAHLAEFAKIHREAEGVIQHVGRETWDLLLIDHSGLWARGEFPSTQAATDACERLGLRCHGSWEDPRLARRMNGRDHWNTANGQRRAL